MDQFIDMQFTDMQIRGNKLFNLLPNNEQFHVNLQLAEDMQNIEVVCTSLQFCLPFHWKFQALCLYKLSERKLTIFGISIPDWKSCWSLSCGINADTGITSKPAWIPSWTLFCPQGPGLEVWGAVCEHSAVERGAVRRPMGEGAEATSLWASQDMVAAPYMGGHRWSTYCF